MKEVLFVVFLLSFISVRLSVTNLSCDKNKSHSSCHKDNGIAGPGDVIISEIMPDPLPPVRLPEEEYVEIFNRTENTLNIHNWSLCVNDNAVYLPSAEILPGEYIILCSRTDTTVFKKYGRVIGLKSFPALPAREAVLYLNDENGNLVHGIEYLSDWYGNSLKESGGWSLEMIDTDFPFYTEGNWRVSCSDKGGTPGERNSIMAENPDPLFHGIENVYPEDSITIKVRFSESVPFPLNENYLFSVEGKSVERITASDALWREFRITIAEALEMGKVYSFSADENMSDFAGNMITRMNYDFGLTGKVRKGDMLFNELLFNPLPDNPDYIELFNCSENIIDASQLYMASINTRNGDTSDIKHVSEERRCIVPGAYYTITTDRDRVISGYFSSDPYSVFETSSLPSMPDDKGHLLLINRETELLDEVIYTEKMHYSLLSDVEGISLEKIRPELSSSESSNWHSASESSGWGTPGARNSSYSSDIQSEEKITLSSGKISPNNDGYEDVLLIYFDPEGIDNVITVTVFNETGSYVRRLVENYLAGDRATLIWDGTADDGSLVRTGIYIILIQLYDNKGRTGTWKKVCTVVR